MNPSRTNISDDVPLLSNREIARRNVNVPLNLPRDGEVFVSANVTEDAG